MLTNGQLNRPEQNAQCDVFITTGMPYAALLPVSTRLSESVISCSFGCLTFVGSNGKQCIGAGATFNVMQMQGAFGFFSSRQGKMPNFVLQSYRNLTHKLKSVKKATQAFITAQNAIQGLQEKKAEDIVLMDLTGIKSALADYFVICHAESDRQVEALAKSAEEFVFKAQGEWPWHSEGYQNAEWILLDYVDVVVHIFQREKREFYAIKDLWGDAEITKVS